MGADTTGLGLYDAMRGDASVADIIQKTEQGNILPSTQLLAGADIEFTDTGREWIVDSLLKNLPEEYSHVVIDCPPTLGILTVNALTASTDVIIPMGADIYSLQGLYQLYSTIEKVKKFCNNSLTIAGILLTRYSDRTILSRHIREGITEKATELGAKIFNTAIRDGIVVKEAQTQQTSLFDYAPKSNPTMDYSAFIDEYLVQEGRDIN
jgi:chromosome partitioning protein